METNSVTSLKNVLPFVFHRDSLTQYIFILIKLLIKFLILFYWITLIILDYLHFTLYGSKSFYQIGKTLYSFLCFLLQIFHCRKCQKALILNLFCLIFILTNFLLGLNTPNFLYLPMIWKFIRHKATSMCWYWFGTAVVWWNLYVI